MLGKIQIFVMLKGTLFRSPLESFYVLRPKNHSENCHILKEWRKEREIKKEVTEESREKTFFQIYTVKNLAKIDTQVLQLRLLQFHPHPFPLSKPQSWDEKGADSERWRGGGEFAKICKNCWLEVLFTFLLESAL